MVNVFKRFDATLVMLAVAFCGLAAYLTWLAAAPGTPGDPAASRHAAGPVASRPLPPVPVATGSVPGTVATVGATSSQTPLPSESADAVRRLRSELVVERELRFRLQRERDVAIAKQRELMRQLENANAARATAERELRALRRSALPQPGSAIAELRPTPTEPSRVFSSTSPMIGVGRALQTTSANAVPPSAPSVGLPARRPTEPRVARRASRTTVVDVSPYAPRRKSRVQPQNVSGATAGRPGTRASRLQRRTTPRQAPAPSGAAGSAPPAVAAPTPAPVVVAGGRPPRASGRTRRVKPRVRVSSRFTPTYRLGRRVTGSRRWRQKRSYRPSFRAQLRQSGFFSHATSN